MVSILQSWYERRPTDWRLGAFFIAISAVYFAMYGYFGLYHDSGSTSTILLGVSNLLAGVSFGLPRRYDALAATVFLAGLGVAIATLVLIFAAPDLLV